MSTEELEKDPDPDSTEPPVSKGRGKKKWVLLGIGFLVLEIGVFGVVYFFGLSFEAESSEETEEIEEVEEVEEVEPERQVNEVFEIRPFVINLADPDGIHYLRLGIGLGVFNPKPGSPVIDKDILLPKLKDYLLTVVGRKTLSEIVSPEGRVKLKREILKGTSRLLPSSKGVKVLEVYLTEFIVQ